jgi:hypothetical protein
MQLGLDGALSTSAMGTRIRREIMESTHGGERATIRGPQ